MVAVLPQTVIAFATARVRLVLLLIAKKRRDNNSVKHRVLTVAKMLLPVSSPGIHTGISWLGCLLS